MTDDTRSENKEEAPGRPWWRSRWALFAGVPALVLLALVGLLTWGRLQPRPEGFAVADSGKLAVAPAENVLASNITSAEAQQADVIEETEAEILRYTLDARSKKDWVLFDFAKGTVVEGDLSSPGWDLAFRRTKLLTNSGVTNPSGPGGAFDLGEVPLEEATPPETVVFVVDTYGGEDEDEAENAAMGRWYTYSLITHIVSVKPNTYLVRTGDDLDALVQFDSYYCEDEEPGCITFRYRLIPKVPLPGQ